MGKNDRMTGPEEWSTSRLSPGSKLTLAAIDLLVVAGPDRGRQCRVTNRKVRVGTGDSAELWLSDPTVSRLHCEIEVRQTGIRIVDLGSTNGVSIQGVRIKDAELVGGGLLVLGATTIRIEPATEAFTIELSPLSRFGDVLGGSMEMRRIYAVLDRVAPTNTTVLIQGETGTGKEAVASAIHAASRRAKKPFVAVDCGAIAEHLIESELFGHVRGAFSGAVQDRPGLFEAAHEGTLFLDEVGELPLSLQPKLLRALEAREVRRVGSNGSRKVDVRVLAATNRPLSEAINDGTFREDLYYRLAVVEVTLPPLRARREDIPVLARHFYSRFAGPDEPLPAPFVEALVARAWPGNVRELRNFIERAVSLGWSERVQEENARAAASPPPGLEALARPDLPLKEARAEWNRQFELLYASALLRKTGGNVTRAAELAEVHRRSFQGLMVDHGLRSSDEQWSEPADENDESDSK